MWRPPRPPARPRSGSWRASPTTSRCSSQRLPLRTTAARIAALVRRHGPPQHLPGRAEFAPGAHDLEARYESAWLACRLLADTGGAPSLVAFYRSVDAGRPVNAELAPRLRLRAARAHHAVADGPVTLAGVSERRWALATFLAATLAFVAVAAWRIPWHPVPGGTPPPAAAELGLHPGPDRPRQRLHRPRAASWPGARWRSRWPSASSSASRPSAPAWWGACGAGGGSGCCRPCSPLAVIGRLATLPFAIVGHHRALSYGLTDEAWGAWTVDLVKGLLLALVLISALPLARAGRLCPPLGAGLAGRRRCRCSGPW